MHCVKTEKKSLSEKSRRSSDYEIEKVSLEKKILEKVFWFWIAEYS